jgi:hypothetical protein
MGVLLSGEGGLQNLELGEVLEIDHAGEGAVFIDDDEVVEAVLLEDGEGVGGEAAGADGTGVFRHEVGDGPGLDVGGAAGEVAAQVAIGEEADDAAGGSTTATAPAWTLVMAMTASRTVAERGRRRGGRRCA